jgi:hypothetical protein
MLFGKFSKKNAKKMQNVPCWYKHDFLNLVACEITSSSLDKELRSFINHDIDDLTTGQRYSLLKFKSRFFLQNPSSVFD